MKSNPSTLLSELLGEATRLTQGGHLAEATAAIQRALGMAPPEPTTVTAAPGGEVLDGLVREVDSVAAAPLAAGGFRAGSFESAFGTRAYKLFVPEGFGGQRLPLVVMLHGCTQDPDDFAAGTRMNTVAAEHGAIVLYPAQAMRSNTSKCWNWFEPADQRRGTGEPALLAAMTEHILATEAVDPDRVYAAGLSAGGAMAAILGREYADLFAAIGVHSGLPAGAANDVASAFAAMQRGASNATPANDTAAPIIVFHGDNDSTVNLANGEALVGGLGSAADTRSASGTANRDATRRIYRDADGTVRAEHWLVHGAGHAWSGGSADGSYADAAGPDASREMMRFFLAHPRRKRAQP